MEVAFLRVEVVTCRSDAVFLRVEVVTSRSEAVLLREKVHQVNRERLYRPEIGYIKINRIRNYVNKHK